MSDNNKRVVLGPEWDNQLRRKLVEALSARSGHARERLAGIAGSQDFEQVTIEIAGDVLIVEAETYEGLSISGPSALVESIQKELSTN
jgi:hypothetical protein